MPELKPCPECGACGDLLLVVKNFTSKGWRLYCDCGYQGRLYPTKVDAISAHNALPRAMRWTHEPPKVAGDCYVRMRSDESGQWKKPFVEHFSEGYLKELKATPLMQFAGPIPAPVEEKP